MGDFGFGFELCVGNFCFGFGLWSSDLFLTIFVNYEKQDRVLPYVCMYFVYMTASGKENLCLLCLVIYDASAEFGTHNGNLFI